MFTLLQIHEHTAQAMDLSFNTKDVVYILTLVGGGLGAWFKLKIELSKMAAGFEVLKENQLNASNGRKGMKKELMQELKDREQILHNRVDRLRDENIKSYEKLEKRLEQIENKNEQSTQMILQAINNTK